jgi:hypothetical protein
MTFVYVRPALRGAGLVSISLNANAVSYLPGALDRTVSSEPLGKSRFSLPVA